ncbi:MAG: hypothetical protein AAF404_11860, partial [Pseudomonadota bacterium]
GMGISEHFEMLFKLPPVSSADTDPVDRLYSPSNSSMGLNKGAWGIMRTYSEPNESLASLSNNPPAPPDNAEVFLPQPGDVIREFIIGVVTTCPAKDKNGKKITPQLRYVQLDEPFYEGCVPVDTPPMVLRASAGEWINIALYNGIDEATADEFGADWRQDNGSNASSDVIKFVNGSVHVGLNPRLLSYDASRSSGLNVGINSLQSAGPGETVDYLWYAGNISFDENNNRVLTPVEFGGVNLSPSDPILQASYGLVGALIVEPFGALWEASEDGLSAIVDSETGAFTEVVIVGSHSAAETLALPGSEVRFRVLNPNADGGPGNVSDGTHLITVEGHNWKEEPYLEASTVIGLNTASQTMGTQQVTPLESYNLLIESAGGESRQEGDYAFYYYPQGPDAQLGKLVVQD